MIYIGIDPGVSGGIAMLDAVGTVVRVARMPETEQDLLRLLRDVAFFSRRAVLERAAASPQMGVVSAFTFGRGYGRLEMALAALLIPFDYVTPATWQKALACRTGGDKNISKRRAQQLFPSLTVTHAIADALLIAEYCRRTHALGARPESSHGKSEKEEGHPSSDGREEGAGAQTRGDGPKESGRAKQIRRRVEQARGSIAHRAALAGSPRHGAGS